MKLEDLKTLNKLKSSLDAVNDTLKIWNKSDETVTINISLRTKDDIYRDGISFVYRPDELFQGLTVKDDIIKVFETYRDNVIQKLKDNGIEL